MKSYLAHHFFDSAPVCRDILYKIQIEGLISIRCVDGNTPASGQDARDSFPPKMRTYESRQLAEGHLPDALHRGLPFLLGRLLKMVNLSFSSCV
jgi:hypothetical protein